MNKNFNYLTVMVGALGLISCTEDNFDVINNSAVEQQTALATRAIMDEPDSLSTIIPLAVDSNQIVRMREKVLHAFSAYDVKDPYFYSNMRAIATAGIIIESRTGQNLTFTEPGKEVTWTYTPVKVMDDRHFYLQIPPASSGIPYMIYTAAIDKPLTVGQYTNNPNHKVLFIPKDESGSAINMAWDLIPSANYPGYFAIESQSYIGQSDPNDIWSVFHYVLETQSNYKVGYAKYSNSSSQEFLITPVNKFTLKYIEFQKEGSTLTKNTPLQVVGNYVNKEMVQQEFNVTALRYVTENSRFVENSYLKIRRENTDLNKKFYRPTVAGKSILVPQPVEPEKAENEIRDTPDMIYVGGYRTIQNLLRIRMSGYAEPYSRVEVTSYLANYTVTIPYTAVFTFFNDGAKENKDVRISGIWHGTIYTTDRDSEHPVDIVKCFDLDTGEELKKSSNK